VTDYRVYLRNQSLPGMGEMETGQQRGDPPPPIEKPVPEGAALIDLTPLKAWQVKEMPLVEALRRRRSRRSFTSAPLSADELSFLLWATQGVEETAREGRITLRTVPSGGAMHPFETYLAIRRVAQFLPGRYRFVATRHALLPLGGEETARQPALAEICNGQRFVDDAAVVFIWAVRPARTEYRYGSDSLKDILISVGHICENLYLACEAIGVGTCAVVSYQQALLDAYLGLDGHDEIPLYLAPVGRV